MDSTDYKILEILQTDGRISMKDLGKLVSLTSPAVSERVRRLEENGIIMGYKAIINPKKLNKHVIAQISVGLKPKMQKAFLNLVETDKAIVECHHLTGDDCMTIKVLLNNTEDLEHLLNRIQKLGSTKTTIILSSPLEHKPILP